MMTGSWLIGVLRIWSEAESVTHAVRDERNLKRIRSLFGFLANELEASHVLVALVRQIPAVDNVALIKLRDNVLVVQQLPAKHVR